MTPEEKDLLLKDLSGRLPYGVKASTKIGPIIIVSGIYEDTIKDETEDSYDVSFIKPYLRPLSSMTNDERFEYLDFLKVEIQDGGYVTENYVVSLADMPMLIDWLLKHHFDYRGLIKIGLALEAPKGMYNF